MEKLILQFLLIKYVAIILLSVILAIFTYQKTEAQSLHFDEIPDNAIVIRNNLKLPNPWAGGLNHCQLSNIDLNLDDTLDLIAFDKHGNRLIPFIHSNSAYHYAPNYVSCFPENLHDWVQFKDYNNDGAMDLFTYNYGSISLYKNTAKDYDTLGFKLIRSTLNSLQNNMEANLYVTDVDFPAIVDIDQDGDLDILTFFGLGSWIDFHKNVSMEETGSSEIPKFQLFKRGWGNIAENIESNKIKLDTLFPYKKSKHTGSCFLITDLEHDNDFDLILSDIGYTNVAMLLSNGNTFESMDTTLLSAYNTPIFPVFSSITPFNDSIQSLVISSFDASTTNPDHGLSLFQLNTYTKQLQLTDSLFLQSTMLDMGTGAAPLLFDLTKDGRSDLFISNSCNKTFKNNNACISGISLFTQSTNGSYIQTTTDWLHLSKLKLQDIHLAIADCNNDLKSEYIIGTRSGHVLNLHTINDSVVSTDTLINNKQGGFSTPTFFDYNKDLLPDIIIGNKNGSIDLYKNVSTTTIKFTLQQTNIGNINVTDTLRSWYGYSSPSVLTDGSATILFIGSESGNISVYDLRIKNDSIKTSPIATNLNNIGYRCKPVANLSNELIVGTYGGGCRYYSYYVNTGLQEQQQLNNTIHIYPNPADDYIQLVDDTPLNSETTFNIISALGVCVLSGKVTNATQQINTNQLENGYYIIRIQNNNSSNSQNIPLIIHH